MATDINFRPMLNALIAMHRAASFGADANALTVTQLKTLIDQVHLNFNAARSAWSDLVTLVGSTKATAEVSAIIAPEPADVGASFTAIRTDALALLNDYSGSVYATGTPAWTYSAALLNGLIDGGHVDASVSSGVLAAINTRCAALRDSLVVLTPL